MSDGLKGGGRVHAGGQQPLRGGATQGPLSARMCIVSEGSLQVPGPGASTPGGSSRWAGEEKGTSRVLCIGNTASIQALGPGAITPRGSSSRGGGTPHGGHPSGECDVLPDVCVGSCAVGSVSRTSNAPPPGGCHTTSLELLPFSSSSNEAYTFLNASQRCASAPSPMCHAATSAACGPPTTPCSKLQLFPYFTAMPLHPTPSARSPR